MSMWVGCNWKLWESMLRGLRHLRVGKDGGWYVGHGRSNVQIKDRQWMKMEIVEKHEI
jgi:hypothetical protein